MSLLPAVVTIANLPAATLPLSGAELIEAEQTLPGATEPVGVKLSLLQVAALVTPVEVLGVQPGLSVFGVAGTASAVPNPIVGAPSAVLRVDDAGQVLGFGPVNLSTSAAVTGTLPGSQMSAVNLATSGNGGVTGYLSGALIGSGTVTGLQIAAGAITSSQIATGAVTNDQIALLTITGNRLASGAITSGQLASGAVTNAQIAPSTITTALLDSGIVTALQEAGAGLTNQPGLSVLGVAGNTTAIPASIAGLNDQVLRVAADGSALSFGAVNLSGANATTGYLSGGRIATATLTSAQIATGTITAAQIASATIATAQLATSIIDALAAAHGLDPQPGFSVLGVATVATAVPASIVGVNNTVLVIANNQVGFGAVDLAVMTTGWLSGSQIGTGTVTALQIATGTIGPDQIADAAIGTQLIATSAVATAQLDPSIVQALQQSGGLIPEPGLSVMGVSGTDTAVPAPIVGTAGGVLSVDASGTVLGFGPVGVASVSGLGPFATSTTVPVSAVTGLGPFATATTIPVSAVSGLGPFATATTVPVSAVTGLGPFATATAIPAADVTGLGPFALSSTVPTSAVTGILPAAQMSAVNLATSGNGGVTGFLPGSSIATASITQDRLATGVPAPQVATVTGTTNYQILINDDVIFWSGAPGAAMTLPPVADTADGKVIRIVLAGAAGVILQPTAGDNWNVAAVEADGTNTTGHGGALTLVSAPGSTGNILGELVLVKIESLWWLYNGGTPIIALQGGITFTIPGKVVPSSAAPVAPVQKRITLADSPYQVTASDQIINVDTSQGSSEVAIVMPPYAGRAGLPVEVKDVSGATTQGFSVTSTSPELIDGAASWTSVTVAGPVAYASVRFVPANDGTTTGWWVHT